MDIGKGNRANILSLGTYAAVGNGINLKKAKACKARLRSSQSKKVRIGMSLLRFFAGRVVEIPRMECFGISGLRILPTVALDMLLNFAFSCLS